MAELTFWDFVGLVFSGVRTYFPEQSRPVPFGLFGRDPTEAMLRVGTAEVFLYRRDHEGVVVIRQPGADGVEFVVPVTADSAAAVSARIYEVLTRSEGP